LEKHGIWGEIQSIMKEEGNCDAHVLFFIGLRTQTCKSSAHKVSIRGRWS
jgi:hypothetical protein